MNMFLVNMGGKYKLVLATHYFFLGKLVDPLGLIKAFDERVAAEFFLRKWGVGGSPQQAVSGMVDSQTHCLRMLYLQYEMQIGLSKNGTTLFQMQKCLLEFFSKSRGLQS